MKDKISLLKFLWLQWEAEPFVTLLQDLIICSCYKFNACLKSTDLSFYLYFFRFTITSNTLIHEISSKLINKASVFFITSGKVKLFGLDWLPAKFI